MPIHGQGVSAEWTTQDISVAPMLEKQEGRVCGVGRTLFWCRTYLCDLWSPVPVLKLNEPGFGQFTNMTPYCILKNRYDIFC